MKQVYIHDVYSNKMYIQTSVYIQTKCILYSLHEASIKQ